MSRQGDRLIRFMAAMAAGALLWKMMKLLKGRFLCDKGPRQGNIPTLIVLLCAGSVLAGVLRMTEEIKPVGLQAILESGEAVSMSARGKVKSQSCKNGICTIVLEGVSAVSADGESEIPALMITAEEDSWIQAVEKMAGEKGITSAEGMRVAAEGSAELFSEARNPGEFDYALYYRSQKMRFRVRASKLVIYDGRQPPVSRWTGKLRAFVSGALSLLCSEEDKGLYEAVLLGQKTELSEDIRQLYQKNGIAHLLAVSGLHVSLIGMSFYSCLRRAGLGFGWAGAAGGAVVFFYGCLTGFGPSVFRAVFMLLCAFLASVLGRTYDLLSAMALSLLLLALDSPFLLFTSGLQLSFGAVGAIGIGTECRKAWSRLNREESGKSALSENFSISLIIQLLTFPVILYHFYEFPIYGIFLNLLVIPLMAYVVGAGIASVSIYGISILFQQSGISLGTVFLSEMGKLFLTAARGAMGTGHYILDFYEKLCIAASGLPGYSMTAGRPKLWKIGLYYGLLAGALYLTVREVNRQRAEGEISGERDEERKKRIRRIAARRRVCLSLTGGIAVLLLIFRPVRGLDVYFLDVGQGDGIFLNTSKYHILVDGGSSQIKNLGKYRLVPFLKSQGISKLDYVFVSHGDLDHISGIEYLLMESDVGVGNLVFSCLSKGDESCDRIAKAAGHRGAAVWYMEEGQSVNFGKLSLTSLYPSKKALENGGEEDKNNQSLVLLAEYGEISMLLTGDVEEKGEASILATEGERLPPEVTVLKAAHHGSKSSSGEEFLDRVRPSMAVLSYGAGNSYGHPSSEVVKRLEKLGTKIWSTEQSGAVMVHTDGERLTVEGFIKGER